MTKEQSIDNKNLSEGKVNTSKMAKKGSIQQSKNQKSKTKSSKRKSETSSSISTCHSQDSKHESKKQSTSDSSEHRNRLNSDSFEKKKHVHHEDNKMVIPTSIITKIKKIESMQGAIMIRNESTIKTAGYFIERTQLNSTEYSQILRARKLTTVTTPTILTNRKAKSDQQQSIPIVVKITNLTECSPRFRANLLKNSVRIMRFIGTLKRNSSTLIFIKIFEIFQMDSVKLYVFMEECQSNPTLYDLVKSSNPIRAEDVRNYFRSLASGISFLQKIGIAHRYLKLQHVLFNRNNQLKLCGWSKAVFFYDLDTKKALLQNSERRVRRNYFLPPEAFIKPYDPSKADIWSLGVLLVAMSTKRYPFNVRDEKTKFSNQWRNFTQKHEMNLHIRSLCNKIFIIDPKHRIDCDRILADRYFEVHVNRLLRMSIRVDSEMVDRESSRVGALSAVDFSSTDAVAPKTSKNVITEAETSEEAYDIEGAAENNEVNQEQQIQDGGAVGEEENLSPLEAVNESQMSENSAPEENESKAIPQETYYEE